MKRIKRRIFEIIEIGKPDDKASQQFDAIINLLIVTSVASLYLQTFNSLVSQSGQYLLWFFMLSTFIFTIEYAMRVWTADLKYPKMDRLKARLRYMRSWYGIVDLLSVLPVYVPNLSIQGLSVIRIFRLGRLMQNPKYTKLNGSINLFKRVIYKKRNELTMTMSLVIALILIAALFMYYAENTAQPKVFENVFDSIWWATITLTTVGYGDIVPITAAGRMLGMLIALLGIGLIALPTGILSGALMEEFDNKKDEPLKCPHCGKKIH